MKVTVIHGQNHHGSTYHLAHSLAEKLGGEMTEFFLPKDFGDMCLGCTRCFMESEKKCPHYEYLAPITAAMDEADVVIFDSPVYVFHVTGSMKAFLDHYGWRFMVHRPEEKMFTKQAVCICTAAGGGMKHTLTDMTDTTFYWGFARTYKLGAAVRSTTWKGVDEKIKQKLDKKLDRIARRLKKNCGHIRPKLLTRVFFFLMSCLQRKGFSPVDAGYWQSKGWTEGKRPW